MITKITDDFYVDLQEVVCVMKIGESYGMLLKDIDDVVALTAEYATALKEHVRPSEAMQKARERPSLTCSDYRNPLASLLGE